jgi:hypothetical protein
VAVTTQRRHVGDLPKRPSSPEGIYPRCVWCDGENYMLAVVAYSAGEIPCAAADGCGRYLPEEYVKKARR